MVTNDPSSSVGNEEYRCCVAGAYEARPIDSDLDLTAI
jgi:hypothetical protein